MGQREFTDLIRVYSRRLNLADFLKKLIFALSVGAAAGIVFQAVSFLIPLYYANVYTGIALLLAVLAAVAISYIRRSTMEHAALVMDGFGFQERIITAYEHLDKEGALYKLQREDAMEQLKAHRDRIQIPLWPGLRKMAMSAALLVVMLGLALMPSQMKDQARELHRIQQEALEKEKEIEEVLEEFKKLEQLERDTLTPEQMAALQEMMESLQSSIDEYSQASSAEALQAAGEKLNLKYENMASQMSGLAQSIQNGAAASPMSMDSMQAMADKLQQMSGNPSPSGSGLASNQEQNGDGQNNQDGSGQSGQNGQGNNQDGQGDGQSGQGNGQSGQGSGQGDSQSGQSGQVDGQSGQGDDQGSGQSGQGDGQDGQGSGQGGQGNGQDGQGGQGSGQGGQGNNSGSGRGTGSASISRDYVSIPNDIADSGNLMGNAANHDNSEFFRTQNGLSWEGEHVSYEAVIGSYEQNAYEGIAAGRYPSGMEDVIKDYFSSFNN